MLPQEEQQRIIAANRKMVREASTLHEWNIRVPTVFAWPMILMMILFMTLFFGVGGLLAGDNDWNGVYIVFGVCTAMAPYFHYLVMADKNYHYRLTTEGIIATYQDTISEVAYTIVRGLAWLGLAWLGVAWLGWLSWYV
ncbi:hypothetical protein OB962_05675 [Aeromonas piscicola]|uniref:Conjugal transfer protein n=1 Tax=Aeromonas piscicola TaxID=600645 RepID=A0ABT7Q983_9GAMM|nr:hypothetical protein [Aeromonas piscicola]MDM5130495.1 hypothetical protein [Aeromonas piscicola]